MRFEEVIEIWTKWKIIQEEAARMLGVSDRTFRRYINISIVRKRKALEV